VIVLDDALTIADVGRWHASLLAAAQPGVTLVIDASRVEQVDGAGVQLLAAAFRDGARRGYDVLLQDPSPALRDAASRLGLSSHLRLDGDAGD
jgi:anti-anti-sigma regulatory factor